MKKTIKRTLIIITVLAIVFFLAVTIGLNMAYKSVFKKYGLSDYDTTRYYTYSEIDNDKYPREVIKIKSGNNSINAYLYNSKSTKGLIVVSPGHSDFSDIKLPEIIDFVDNGWMVLCYDYTGCYGSEGENMVGYTQTVYDLSNVLNYIDYNDKFENLSIFLFGHSLGAYASCAVLNDTDSNITAVVACSGFDNPTEQWAYSVKRSTGVFGGILKPFAKIQMKVKFGEEANLSAIDGINSSNLPILLINGTVDEFYGEETSIYTHKDKITNPNCSIQVMDEVNHNGHYDYFLTDEALEYQKLVSSGGVDKVDKFLYLQHDKKVMKNINEFFLSFLSK